MVGPGPQQPSSVHSESQIWFCCSVWSRKREFYVLFPELNTDEPTHSQKLTADAGGGVALDCDGLIAGSEEAGPLPGVGVAELGVILQHHLPSTHLPQRAQPQPAQVLGSHHHKAVLPTEDRFP